MRAPKDPEAILTRTVDALDMKEQWLSFLTEEELEAFLVCLALKPATKDMSKAKALKIVSDAVNRKAKCDMAVWIMRNGDIEAWRDLLPYFLSKAPKEENVSIDQKTTFTIITSIPEPKPLPEGI